MEKIITTDEEWKKKLSSEEYRVLRERRTEPAFSGKYYKNQEQGTYHCAACGNELFSSNTKYDSGSGWPSFSRPWSENIVEYKEDKDFGMRRVEVICKKCGSHLGHVFDDGPQVLPRGQEGTGKRYCINSLSLRFKKNNS